MLDSEIKTKKNNTCSAEYLSNDILDEDFLSSFAPIRCVQLILGTCRVDGRDRFVTPPTLYQRLYSMILIILICSVQFRIIYIYNQKYNDYRYVFPIAFTLSFCMISMYLANMIHVRFYGYKDNVKFYVIMQELDHLLKMNQKNIINQNMYKLNVFTIIFILSIYMIALVIASTQGLSALMTLGITLYIDASFVFETNHCSNIMAYFALRVCFVNCIITKYLREIVKNEVIDRIIPNYESFIRLFKEFEDKYYDYRYISTLFENHGV
ncbi:uncharacterized protein LOC128202339 [Galleria mellonella]|uniref:Uncharacterized protein LOC128202339 n=1 Tax=Galleria mellonella TaxID=7137 RepID=A0ABM3N3W1_GALME|nr:uncharacterized protein LOC128202339 [Galleria mellonella]